MIKPMLFKRTWYKFTKLVALQSEGCPPGRCAPAPFMLGYFCNVTGPITDEVIHDEQGKGARLTVKYQLTKTEVFKGLGAKGEGFSFELLCTALQLRRVI